MFSNIIRRYDESYVVLTRLGNLIEVEHTTPISRGEEPKLSPEDIAELFPRTKTAVREAITQTKQTLTKIQKEKRDLRNEAARTCRAPWKQDLWYELLVAVKVQKREEEAQHHLQFLEKILWFQNPKEKRILTGGVSQAEIERAKSVPIPSLPELKFNRSGFALCPWHQEKTPSLKYYQKDNQVHCFGCDKHADVITLVQRIRNIDFISAVQELTNGTNT